MLVINDIHLGVKRTGGTTPASQIALADYLHESFRSFIMQHTDKDLVINGDLFDAFQVDPRDLVRAFNTLADWLESTDHWLTLIAGNHDYQPRAGKLSSFEMLCLFLTRQFQRVEVVDQSRGLSKLNECYAIVPTNDYCHPTGGIYAIPHMPNQDLFNIELGKVPEDAKILLLHANYDNPFAERADHSLNVSMEQAAALVKNGTTLVFAHEHQGRTDLAGQVVITGNQWPSSVSDCLAHGSAQRDGLKRALVLDESGAMSWIETWDALGSFVEQDWRDLDSDAQFIRVTGSASAAEAADVVNAIAKFRPSSSAFVVTNAVKVDGMESMEDLATVQFESIKSFDVLGALLEELTDEEARVVKEVLSA